MADEKKLGFLIVAKDLASKEFKSVNGEISKLEKQTKGAKTGMGGLLSTVNLSKVALFGAAAGATALLGAGIKVTEMAIDEEKNIAKLTTSLKANIVGFDGNTDAIERTIAKREGLAFTDDELRDSMARLVAVTHDVDKAFDVQQTAMDLARFKGISLGEATEALTKVEGGQFRILKSLGIQLPKNATAQQALNAVQKVAFGQAKAYASTTAGKFEAAQIRVNDRLEDFGARILPLVSDALDALTGHSTQLSGIGDSIDSQIAQGMDLSQTKAALEQGLRELGVGTGGNELIPRLITGDQIAELESQLAKVKVIMSSPFSVITKKADDARQAITYDTDQIGDTFSDMVGTMITDARTAIDDAYDPLINHERLLGAEAEIAAAKRALAADGATQAERLALAEAEKDMAGYMLALAETGDTTSGAFKQGIALLKEQIKNATGPTKAYLQGVLDKILAIERAGASVPINFLMSQAWGNQPYVTAPGKASGGPVSAGQVYTVGEQGPELFVPGSNGTIIPNGASGGVVVNFNSVWPPTREQAREIAQLVDREQYSKGQRAVPTVLRT